MLSKFKSVSNPLTIIAIFAGLAEISGTVILPILDPKTQSIYVWFLIAFPLTLVILFFFTLNKNHKVLYAPSDFENDEGFLKALDEKFEAAEKSIEVAVGEAIKGKLEQSIQSQSLVRKGTNFVISENYALAIETFKDALKVFPDDSDAKVGLANALNFQDERNHELPVKLITEALETNRNNAHGLYNRACIKALNHNIYGIENIINDLLDAISLSEGYREKAITDDDFKFIKGTKEFILQIQDISNQKPDS